MPRRKSQDVVPISDYEHAEAKRVNNPPVGLAHLDREETPVHTLAYDPHLDPQLVWAGKAEHAEVEVPAPSIHVHEELSAEKIVAAVRRTRPQQALFDIDHLDPDKAIEFYRHDLEWSNRMILGDSLLVMSSLLVRERLAGQVQTIYIDPPYGVNYNSNFQNSLRTRGGKEGSDDALTREPEMIQAYRDTWELGVHSYLTYLRDRLVVARELLADSGSVFVQISVDRMHLVRTVLDEVFGADQHMATITFVKTSSAGSPGELKSLPATADFIIWYAKDRELAKFRALYRLKTDNAQRDEAYSWVELGDGSRRRMTAAERSDPTVVPDGARIFRIDNLTSQSGVEKTRYPVVLDGREFRPAKGVWKTSQEGMERLIEHRRVIAAGNTLGYVRYLDDFGGQRLGDVWTDTITSGFAADKRYVVQTNARVIARCVLMSSDPGDLVLDPTCGSGTTAYVAEQYGRRWITIDTSRVALAIARERLLTARFEHYEVADPKRGVDSGLLYERLRRVTLRSIARGEDPETVVLYDRPMVDADRVRVSGPFTVEALSRYAENPLLPSERKSRGDASAHVGVLLDALEKLGIPRPGQKPLPVGDLTRLNTIGSFQAEGVLDTASGLKRVGVSLGPRFGALTMAMVSQAVREAVAYDLVVFAGFAADAEAQAKLSTGRFGGVEVALLLANPDLLLGDLLKNTTASQTFRLYASPDVLLYRESDGHRVEVKGVDSFDAATGGVRSYGRANVQAWFLDSDYDGQVFRVSQAFFPVTNAWERLARALRGTVDAELVESLHGWTSLPFSPGSHDAVAVRVITDDGNASETVLQLNPAS